MLELNKIYNEDCLEGMSKIDDKSIDMILCDLPYGVTARNKWDSVLNPDLLWEQYLRIIKENGAIVLFGQDKFTATMMMSQPKLHRYNLVWDKELPSGFLNANRMPLRRHEDIMVFYKKLPKYNPQKFKGKPNHTKGKAVGKSQEEFSRNTNYGKLTAVETEGDMKFPTSILKFQKPHPSTTIHSTQKPVELCEWLIKSFTDEGQIVLDNCMGSGTTALACINTNRMYIGFEKDKEIFDSSIERIHSLV
ncbi:DNA-methyltransferase [Metabacillus sp. Hm71]|uniref:DNA-methyltransferase n=1 Tax=Metabacillus sp. Hm71 TaxID=3450743 RepID=UPI003F42F922